MCCALLSGSPCVQFLKPERKVVPAWFLRIESNDLDGLIDLIAAGELPDLNTWIRTDKWDGGITVLGRAALMCNTAIVDMLLSRGAEVDKTCATHTGKQYYSPANKFTALGAAICYGNADLARLLLSRGASVKRLCFNDAYTPLQYAVACLSSRLDTSRLHFTPEAQQEMETERQRMDTELARIVRDLLAGGAEITSDTHPGRHSLLGLAVIKGHANIASLLIEHGADVSSICFTTTTGSHAYTPLGLAVSLRFADVADALRAAGAKDDQLFKFGGKMIKPSDLLQKA